MARSALGDFWWSAQEHTGLVTASERLETGGWAECYPPSRWKEVLGLGFRLSGDLDRLRETTSTGRPFGSGDFVAELEAKLDRGFFP